MKTNNKYALMTHRSNHSISPPTTLISSLMQSRKKNICFIFFGFLWNIFISMRKNGKIKLAIKIDAGKRASCKGIALTPMWSRHRNIICTAINRLAHTKRLFRSSRVYILNENRRQDCKQQNTTNCMTYMVNVRCWCTRSTFNWFLRSRAQYLSH